MDSILFYGDKGEASRRQVRSAAAQHSHRIGPRKPKSSKRPRTDTPPAKKRSLAANTIISLGPADLEKKANKSSGTTRPRSANATAHTPNSPTPARARPVSRGSIPSYLEHDNDKRLQESERAWKEFSNRSQVPPTPPPELPPNDVPKDVPRLVPVLPPIRTQLQAPLAPPLVIERIPPPTSSTASHSRQSSAASGASPSNRLPQYSWTEYPRYGTSFPGTRTSLQVLAHAAVGDDESSESRPPPSMSASPLAGGHVPNFRQYSAEPMTTERRELPDPWPSGRNSSSGSFHSTANGQERVESSCQLRRSSGDGKVVVTQPEARERRELVPDPLPSGHTLDSPSGLDHFLQGTLNGQESRRSSGDDRLVVAEFRETERRELPTPWSSGNMQDSSSAFSHGLQRGANGQGRGDRSYHPRQSSGDERIEEAEPRALEWRAMPGPPPFGHARDSSFGAFLQRAANGQEHVEGSHQRWRYLENERIEGEIKREVAPGGGVVCGGAPY